MIYSILQLITALTLVNNPSSISTLSNEGNVTLSMPGVYSSIDNIDDDLKVMYYYGDVQLLSADFLDTEWKKGLNLWDGQYIQGDGSHYGFKFIPKESGFYTLTIPNIVTNLVCFDVDAQDNVNDNPSSNTLTSSLTMNKTYCFYVYQNGSWNAAQNYSSSCMINKGSASYSYQPYHSDSELFDVQYDEIAFAFDLEELDTGTSYQDYFDFWVSFSFASRVQYDGDEYTYSLRDLYFGFSRRDYDQPYPLFPILNYFIYSSYNFSIDSLPANFRYTSTKTPLIYSSTDSYESLHCYIDDVVQFSSYDVLEFSLCFEHIDENIFNLMVDGAFDLEYSSGYNNGYRTGYENGVEDGKKISYDTGYADGKEDGIQIGIAEGREQVIETGQTASIIFNGIISVGLLPTNVFLQMLNLEVFGINIGALVSSLLTILIIIIIGRMLFGGKNEV